MARTKGTEVPISAEEVEKLASIGATQAEMAAWFGVSLSTIEKRMRRREYRTVLDRGGARFRISLRRRQAQLAEEGNPAMLIWLGKQVLGQQEPGIMEHKGQIEIGIHDSGGREALVGKLASLLAQPASNPTSSQPPQ